MYVFLHLFNLTEHRPAFRRTLCRAQEHTLLRQVPQPIRLLAALRARERTDTFAHVAIPAPDAVPSQLLVEPAERAGGLDGGVERISRAGLTPGERHRAQKRRTQ